jgi:polysaccharide pyruvyl transferase WcaK-like protein
MKISLVTIIDNDQNIGTYLQAYALSKVFERKGHDVELVDYYRKNHLALNVIRNIWKANSNPLFGLLSIGYRVSTVAISKYMLKGFLAKNAKLSKRCYTSFEELEQYLPEADVYITGSDQVWNSYYNEGIEKVYYLAFAPKGKKKFSYAASIGMECFPEHEIVETRNLLSDYTKISVRESSAVKTLADIGINDVEHVVDPTLLISNEEWTEIAKTDSFVKTEPYLLIYSVEDSKKAVISKYAHEIAKKLNLKVYMVTAGSFREKIECDRIFYFARPERFLNLMLQADFVIVSSFHGTTFSVSMNKQFISISPDKFNSRIYSLLETLGLIDRIKKEADFPLLDLEPIDYSVINGLMSKEIVRSETFIDLIMEVAQSSLEVDRPENMANNIPGMDELSLAM